MKHPLFIRTVPEPFPLACRCCGGPADEHFEGCGVLKYRAEVIEECALVAEGGSFLHDAAPSARFGRECAAAIRALVKEQT